MKKVLLLSMMAGIALASYSDNDDEPASPVIPPSSSETTLTEWTSTQIATGEYIVNGYANVGFRVVRVDR